MTNTATPDEELAIHHREKQFYLFLVAFGGHKSTIKILKDYLRYGSGKGISHFFYLEYLLHEPLPINNDFIEDGGSVFCPFLERMIKEQPFLLDWDRLKEALDKNDATAIKNFLKIKTAHLPRTRELERKFLKEPLEIETGTETKNLLTFGNALFANWKDPNNSTNPIIPSRYSLKNLKKDLNDIILATDISKSNRDAGIKERVVLIYPWARSGGLNESKYIDIIGVPIASDKLFYGYILVGFFHEGPTDNKNTIIRDHIKKEMEDQANNFYLPALILCHHSLYEKFYLSYEKFCKDPFAISQEDMPFCFEGLSRSNNMLERNIHKLWEMRRNQIAQFNDKDFRKSNFIFKGRFWGSPKSIRKIEEALTWDMNFATSDTSGDENKNKLKTFLIFGGPGSGKDTLSKMIGLFSSKHTFSEPYIVNMAALKPDWIAPPSLAGMTVKIAKRDPFTIDGIFKKVLDKAKSDEAKNIPNNYPVIIFDELNSLDIDTQGTLLRILENAEIVPIGGIDKEVETDDAEKLLVVGVVNEAPHQLTLEDTVKSFSRDKSLWGNLLGTALYESFRGVRRLRDDLYYRFIRGGYIELPDLDDRRADIPIIFFASLPDWLRDDIVGKASEEKIFVEYDVWDLLTDVEIQWKGNIRQLQAVANNIAREVKKEEIKGIVKSIDVPLVKRALEDMKKAHES